MNFKRLSLTLFGFLLFFGGAGISLTLSSFMLWGELEARLYTPQTGDTGLKIECPLMIAAWESAQIHAVVTNTLPVARTKPQVNAFISHSIEARMVSDTLELGPLESQAMQWTVSGADIVYDRLVLVNIVQRPYGNLPSSQGACSILVYSLFGMNGANTLNLVVIFSVLASLVGAGLLYRLHRPFSGRRKSFTQISFIFLLLSLFGLIAALTRLWGLTLFFNATALIVLFAGNIEIFLPQTRT
jgi:hypothetical protein